MSILTFFLGLGIGFGAGTGVWRKLLARVGAWATAASTATPFTKRTPVPVNGREKRN
ncbi:MAG: hypothetical protein P4L36_20485 [Holophaga sp.]|nr:hypothetical protein [Holophaga sp.]